MSKTKGILLGCCMIVLGALIFWFNESQYSKQSEMYEQVISEAVQIDDIKTLDPANEGKLVLLQGTLSVQAPATDTLLLVSSNVVALKRNSQFYQWDKKTQADSEDPYYKTWRDKPVSALDISDTEVIKANYPLVNAPSQIFYSPNVRLGAYRLTEALLAKQDFGEVEVTNLSISRPQYQKIMTLLAKGFAEHQDLMSRIMDDLLDLDRYSGLMHVTDNGFYFGDNEYLPNAGDVEVKYTVIPPSKVTVLGQVKGDAIVEYTADNGEKLALIHAGSTDLDTLISEEQSDDGTGLWVMRILGLALIIFGALVLWKARSAKKES